MSARLPTGHAGSDQHAPNPTPTTVDHLHLIRDCLLDEQRFVRAVFSGRLRGRSVPWKRVVLRPITVKGRLHVQFTYYDDARSVDRNLEGSACAAELRQLLRLPFRNIHVETVDRIIQLNASRRGEFSIRSTARAAPAARPLEHDRRKHLPLPPGERDDYLVAVGIMSESGC